MRTAIIGLGVIGKVHYEVLKKQGEDIVAVCDINPEVLGDFECVKKYLNYKVMLDVENIDVVHICTPHYLHAEMVAYALNAGINVLCEKPLCISDEEIQQVLEAEARTTAQLGVCFQNRYNFSSQYAKSFLFGKNVRFAFGSVRWHRDEAYYKSADWRGKWQTEGGGVLINQAIHTIDLLEWILGEPKRVVGGTFNLSLKDVIEVEDTAIIDFVGDNSFTLFATNSAPQDMPVELRFVTDNDILVVTPDSAVLNGEAVDIEKEIGWYGKQSYGSGHEKLIRDFYDCLAHGKKFEINGKEGAKAVKLVLAAYKSKGEIVTL